MCKQSINAQMRIINEAADRSGFDLMWSKSSTTTETSPGSRFLYLFLFTSYRRETNLSLADICRLNVASLNTFASYFYGFIYIINSQPEVVADQHQIFILFCVFA